LTTVTIPDPVRTIDEGNDVYGENTLLEWAFSECGKLSLASQARLKKITVISYQKERKKLEQAQKQREAEERTAQKKREREEREAQVQAEREAQAKREQEEREAQRQRAEEERAAQAKREQEEREAQQAVQAKQAEEERARLVKIQRGAEITSMLTPRLAPISPISGVRRLNRRQFAEFMSIYEEYDAAKKQGYDISVLDVHVRSIHNDSE
jgi:flagellar biosynthesis GTPase FlhF